MKRLRNTASAVSYQKITVDVQEMKRWDKYPFLHLYEIKPIVAEIASIW